MKFNYFFIAVLLTVSFNVAGQVTDSTLINHTDKNGLKQGYWEKVYPNGKIAYSMVFKDNRPVGDMKRFHENGKLKAFLSYDLEGVKAKARYYDINENLVAEGWFYLKDKDSTWTYFSQRNQIVLIENYRKGLKNGLETHFYPNGQKSEEIQYKNNLKHGLYKRYNQYGQLVFEVVYAEGLMNGRFKLYHRNGKLYLNGAYEKDIPKGFWSYFHENGKIEKTIEYDGKGVPVNIDEMLRKETKYLDSLEKMKGKIKEINEDEIYNKFYTY